MSVALMLYGMGFLGNYFICVLSIFAFLLAYMMIKRKMIFPKNKNFYILLAFSIIYSVIMYFKNKSFAGFILIAPSISYYCGIVIYEFCKNDEKYIIKYIFAIAIGLFIHGMLNYSINIGNINRNTIDFWNNNMLSATLQGTMLTMIMSLFFWIMVYNKKNYIKIIYLICYILSLLYLTVLATRTTIIISIVVLLIVYFINGLLNKKTSKNIKILIIGCIFIIFANVIYNNNMFNLKNIINKSNLIQRMSQKEGLDRSDKNRFEAQLIGIKYIINNPFGSNSKIGDLDYAHNFWIDVGKEAGIIPFILIVLYTINYCVSLVGITKHKEISVKYKIFLWSIYLGVSINFFVEPILQGIPFYFMIFTLINGMVDSQYIKLKSGGKNENTLDS